MGFESEKVPFILYFGRSIDQIEFPLKHYLDETLKKKFDFICIPMFKGSIAERATSL
jgi:predicted GTPase